MTKKLALLLVILLLLLPLSCCGKETVELPPGYDLCTVILPSSDREKTRFNAPAFEVEPFQVNLPLPSGWTVREGAELASEPDFPAPIAGLWCIQYLFDEQGTAVGSLGYFLAPVYDDPDTMEDPQALFAGINLARHSFDCKGKYTPVVRKDGLRAATTAVVREALNAAGDEAGPENDGILIRDEKRRICLGIEMEKGRFTPQELTDLATSLIIEDKG